MLRDLTEVLRIAERRRNLVTRDDLRTHGLNDRQIDHLLASQVLHPVRRSVYSTVAAPFELEQRALALCLTLPTAVTSGAFAAAYWELRRAPRDRLEITVPAGTKVAAAHGALVRRSNFLPDHHVVTTLDGLRVTSPARTLFDAGGWLDRRGHLSMVQDARDRKLVTDAELGEVWAELHGRGRRGSAAFVEMMEDLPIGLRPTMSEYEERLARALQEIGLPVPTRQHPVQLPDGTLIYLDLFVLDSLIDVEVDHTHWHGGMAAMMRDRHRDNQLALCGIERLRFTELDIDRRLRASAGQVRDLHERRLELFDHLPAHLRRSA